MQPYTPPYTPPTASPPKERGFLLTAFLLLTMMGNMALVGVFLLGSAAAARLSPDPALDPAGAAFATHTHNTLLLLTLLTVANLVFLSGTWMWKQWGVYGYGIVTFAGMLAGMHVARSSVFVNLIWAIVIVMIIVPKWQNFD
jgi:hypothetical protein